MSMPLSNALQSQIITDAHFLHHPIVDSEFTRKLKYARMDSENIYLPPLTRGNNHNYDGKSVVEIRKLDISKEPWPFNYVDRSMQRIRWYYNNRTYALSELENHLSFRRNIWWHM